MGSIFLPDNQDICRRVADVFVIMRIVAIYEKYATCMDSFRAVIDRTSQTAFVHDHHFQALVDMEPIETISYGVHIRKVLKIYVVGRVSALFVPFFFSHNFIPAAKSPPLKYFILIIEVKINGILEIIYIA